MACHFCFNAHVWHALERADEDLFETPLTDENDASSVTIGSTDTGYQMYFNSGRGAACNIELMRWRPDYGWAPIARYFPKFCPECGRALTEYKVHDRGQSFSKNKEEV